MSRLPAQSFIQAQIKNTSKLCLTGLCEGNPFSNNRCLDCLLNRLFRRRSKTHQNSASLAFVRAIHPSVTGGFPSQRVCYVETVSVCWRHHDTECKEFLFKIIKIINSYVKDILLISKDSIVIIAMYTFLFIMNYKLSLILLHVSVQYEINLDKSFATTKW